ncbi:MAG: DNA polymerase III subunit alpha, partial [Erysipelotrichaceae bacterium]|nr:DNA polymerase III subunit alpha [Erysipelotrichaceae bacterium]
MERAADVSFFDPVLNRYNKSMIHLHTRSCYSLLQSPFQPQQIVQAAKRNHMSHAALTDLNTMSGTMAFYHECLKEGIEPVIGLEIETEVLNEGTGLILLAKNEAGLKNLFALSTAACTSESTKLDFETVKKHSENCIVLSAGDDDWQERLCTEGRLDALIAMLSELDQAFEEFYVSVAVNDSVTARKANQYLKSAARSLSIETTALSRVEYEYPQDVQKLQLMRAIDLQTTIADPKAYARKGRYFRSAQEMEELYEPEDLQTADKIARSIHIRLTDRAALPDYQNSKGLPSDEYLTKLCHAGLYKRCRGQVPEDYRKRLEYELDVILKMGFANYFLIVYDFIRHARQQNILVGPGRGSAAGSLVAFCLGITHIDPIAANLLFERFLNPERISMPDIDTDFPDDKRDEVIEYVHDLYGKYHVAHIVTFSTMKARMVLRDVARATGVSVYEADRLCKLIGNAPGMTLERAYRENEKFRRLVDSRQELEQLYKRSLGLEGLPRHASLHAGGIVFSKEPVYRYAPLVNAGSHIPAVQFTMEYLEELGLIKFDFLGLKNLSALENMRQMVSASEKASLDLFKVPLDDPKVYRLLSRADTLGVFQLESAGIRNLLKEYQPARFEDIAA